MAAGPGISVGLFIPSQAGRRLPLREGLPTLEEDRHRPVDLAARHAQALGADTVYIGDPAPSGEELAALSQAGQEEKGRIVLKARLLSHDPFLQDLLSQPMTARLDPAQDAIRAVESRNRLQGHTIQSDETADQPVSYGDITVDNEGYGRYMGEVQISLKSYPGGPNSNRAAISCRKNNSSFPISRRDGPSASNSSADSIRQSAGACQHPVLLPAIPGQGVSYFPD